MKVIELFGTEMGTMVRSEKKPTILLIAGTFILVIQRYFGFPVVMQQWTGMDNELSLFILMFLSAFVLMGIVPLVIIKFIFKESLNNYGLVIGNWKTGIRQVAVLLPIITIFLWLFAARDQEIRSFYPFVRSISDFSSGLFFMETARVLFFYTAWEFFFRGFLLFGLREHFGDWMAICIQLVPQCLWHIGMPSGEIIASIPAGVLFGLMALKTRSIIWPLVLHAAIGVVMDILIILTA